MTELRSGGRPPTGPLPALLLVLGLLAAAAPAFAALRTGEPRYEFTLAAGGANASENSLVNIVPDHAANPDYFLDFRVRQNLSDRLAFGVHVFGTGEETGPYSFQPPGSSGPLVESFHLALVHIGVHGRFTIAQGPLRPYAELGVSYVSGSLESGALGQLSLNGGAVMGCPGVDLLIGPHLALGVEGVLAWGTANWERPPFSNSANTEYDPSLAALAGTLSWRFGR
jgi:hypothetical protein